MLTENELKRMAFLEEAERQEHEGRSWMPTTQKLELAELRKDKASDKTFTISDGNGMVIGRFPKKEDRDAAMRYVPDGMEGEEW
jgi:hypothetical protein